jgi:SAM-dependent methyltransferase
MGENTIEIRDDAINVEEIMQKIRENIRHRKAAGELPPDPDTLISNPSNLQTGSEDTEELKRDLAYTNSNWDIHNNSYFIRSHHPYIGKFLMKGRQLVHGEVRRYVDPVISWQTEFNASTVRIMNRTSRLYEELEQHQLELETAFSSINLESDKKIADCITTTKKELDLKIESTTKDQAQNLELMRRELNAEIETRVQEQQLIMKKNRTDIDRSILSHISDLNGEFTSKLNQKVFTDRSELALFIKDLFAQMDEDIHTRAWLAHILEDRVQKELGQKNVSQASPSTEDTNYFLFEERFRGSREAITQRQRAFLPYFEKCSRVLDIGCGRGEFLEILNDHAIGGIGVDSDPDMVAYCRSRQLEVEHSDAIAYLGTLEDKSLDGIFIDQVVEHLEPDYLIRLLALCHQKLKFGYHIVVETVNPTSFVSFVNFYIDMTHKRPVHPETLQYLFTASGFRECEKKFFSPVSDESRLKTIEGAADMNEAERKNIDMYNHNVEMLNAVLFGAQDYAVIGKK